MASFEFIEDELSDSNGQAVSLYLVLVVVVVMP
jgi:hypothetical protein